MKKHFNKLFLIKLLLFVSIFSFSQERYKQDSIRAHSLIEVKKKGLIKKGISETICLFDDAGRLFIIWKTKKKIKYSSFNFNSKKTKWSTVKCLTKNKPLLNKIIEQPDLIGFLNNKECDEMAHTFIKINVIVEKGDDVFENYFFTNCNQENEIKELVELYHYLIS